MKSSKTKLISIIIMAISILLLTALPVSSALAYNVGPNNPSAAIDVAGIGSVIWQNPENVIQPGTPYATATLFGRVTTHYLQATGYGFSVPDDAIIMGIEVQVNRQVIEHNAGLVDNSVRLVKDATIVGDNKAMTTTWGTSFALVTYGSPTDRWGTTWSPAEVNDPDFGVAFSVQRTNNGSNNRTAVVDSMQITVYYVYSSTLTVSCGDGTPVEYGNSVICTATVTRNSGNQTPDGLVTWSSSGSGTFNPNPCSVTGTAGISTCTATYTPTQVGAGSHLVTAAYDGGQYFKPESVSQAVSVTHRHVTVTADSQTKVYGTPDPELTYTFTPTLAFTDTFTGSLTRAPGEDVGSYAISQGSLALNANYNLAFVGNFLEITLGDAVCTVEPYTVTYDGVEHTATGTCLGIGGVILEGLDLTGTIHTEAGVYTDTWFFTSPSGDYADQSGEIVDTINKAEADCTVTAYDVPYDGTDHTATGSCTGVLGEDLTGLDLTLTTHTDAGTYDDSWTFTNTNYNDQEGSLTDTISPVDAVCTIEGWSGTYDGETHGASGVCLGVDGQSLDGLDLGGLFSNVPGGTANWSFSNPNYNPAGGSVEIVINKADPVCTINGWTGVFDGQEHAASGECLGVDGLPLTGLSLGDSFSQVPGGTAFWVFTDSTGNYNDMNGSVDIVIEKADPVCTIVGWTGVYDGNPHGASGECVGVDGLPLDGLNLGSTFTNVPGGTADWLFSDVIGNYNDMSGSVDIAINKAEATCTVTPYTVEYNKLAHTATGSCTGVMGEQLSGLDLSGTTHMDIGTFATDPWIFTDVTGNYNDANGTVSDEITKRFITLTADPKIKLVGKPDPQFTVKVTAGELLEGDGYSGRPTRQPGEAPGQYSILQGTLTLPDYYEVTFVSSYLTIIGNTIYMPIMRRN